MNVVEIKNNLVKISYEPSDMLALSGFVIIEDENTPYVAQVMNLRGDENGNFAIVKLLFTFNSEGILKSYNGTVPSYNSVVSPLPVKDLLDVIPVEKPVIIGKLAQLNTTLRVDKSIFENNLLICSSNFDNTSLLIDNFIKQLDEKIVIIDTEGVFKSDSKITFPNDFKLPLNYDTINYIYENDLEDTDSVSKAIIQDIFLEVQEYTKTLSEGYLPFNSFFNVVDSQFKETQIPQLVLLKNKLLKYKEEEIFADDDISALSRLAQVNDPLIIDISGVQDSLQKEVISYIYGVLNSLNVKMYSFVKISNDNSDKKLLRLLTSESNIYTTIICPHEYKYVNELKEISQNKILFTPQTLQHDFLSYNTFLNKLNGTEFVIFGAHTQDIPLIIQLSEFSQTNYDDEPENSQETEETKKSQENVLAQVVMQDLLPETTEKSDENIEDEVPEIIPTEDIAEEPAVEEVLTENTLEEISEEPVEISDEPVFENVLDEQVIDEQTVYDEPIIEQMSDEQPIEESSDEPVFEVLSDEPEANETVQEFTEEFSADEPENVPEITADEPIIENISDDKTDENISELVTENADDVNISDTSENVDDVKELTAELEENVILTDEVSDDEPVIAEQTPSLSGDELVEQVAKDVDKIFYEKLPEEPEIVDDELNEDDLNLIEDLTDAQQDSVKEFTEDDIVEENPVPVYPADDIEAVDTPSFEPGDRVSTPKYGEGVVEKMIKYGNKMLCSIDFPNIGRRLLDPAMTEITKLS